MATTKLNIYQKLLKIQQQVKGLSKDKKSHNYDYVTGNKLLSFIKPLMDEQGLILKQEVLEIENTRQDYEVWDKWKVNEKGTKGDWKPKNEILSKVMMKFTWIDCETGQKDENMFGANGQNDWEKGLGSALTYAERYFLLKFFHIATDEDDIDNPNRKKDNNHGQEVKKPSTKKTDSKKAQPKPKTKSAVSNLDALIKVLDTNKEKALKQLVNDRYVNKEQHSKLSKVLSKEELSGVEVR